MEEEIVDTSGFYKNKNGALLFGPNFVLNINYELRRETRNQYIYPIDGWYWFDSKEEALVFFEEVSHSNQSSGIVGFFKGLFGG